MALLRLPCMMFILGLAKKVSGIATTIVVIVVIVVILKVRSIIS